VAKILKNREFGTWGEEQACQFLIRNGVKIITRNQLTPYGEIDIIGKDENQIIFCEVKVRSGKTFGNPEESIHALKKQHMINSAEYFFQNCEELTDDWRIDVIAIYGTPQKVELDIQWFKNAISCC